MSKVRMKFLWWSTNEAANKNIISWASDLPETPKEIEVEVTDRQLEEFSSGWRQGRSPVFVVKPEKRIK